MTTIDELEERVKELERWHNRNGMPLLANHNESFPAVVKVVNPEFIAQTQADEKARIARLKTLAKVTP